MSEEVPEPKLVVKQPTKDVRIRTHTTLTESKMAAAKKAAPAKRAPARKAAR